MIDTRSRTTSEAEIRTALHRNRLRYHRSQPDTLIVNELGLAHALGRVDVAVVNGLIHGYEIKSSRDNLARLENQLSIYEKSLQKLTIVSDSKHLPRVLVGVPDWCGVIEAKKGPRGGIRFRPQQSARLNPDVDPFMLAHLLWKREVEQLLLGIGYSPSELRHPRKRLYEMLCEVYSLRQLTKAIRYFMVGRPEWRGHR
ncbi:MAG: sce7726 family protein [Gammaproteobacteria bacterium]|nr:sce7726 family protein [Gammaproteobacteria bacterium]MDE0414643.1 sce7726 family protein [Gammaproteobacteria bacterium]